MPLAPREPRPRRPPGAGARAAGTAPTMGAVPAPSDAQRSRPIGVFDSGVGGLTVLHELLVSLPHEDFVYLGDTARFPYGERTHAELEAFSVELAQRLLDGGAKL